MTKIVYVSTYVPRKCGLATYTSHLRQAVSQAKGWKDPDRVVVLTDRDHDVDESAPFLWPLKQGDREAYRKMAAKINRSDVDVVSLQHEFGIFGGEAGKYILDFVHEIKKPLVTTFHTVFERPVEPYASIQREIATKSDKIIVMNRKGRHFLSRSFNIDANNIVYLPHGTPEPETMHRQTYRNKFGWSERKVMMTFGLLSRGKGIEMILNLMPQVVDQIPNVLYAIVGQTHPEVKKKEGEQYRQQLQHQIRASGLEEHVVMLDEYVPEQDLIQRITACDLYITPYPGMEQITSGTLAYAVGLGKPVLSTPYVYARDLLSRYDELLIPFEDQHSWQTKIVELLAEDDVRAKWEKRMVDIGKNMQWKEVGKLHLQLFSEVKDLAVFNR